MYSLLPSKESLSSQLAQISYYLVNFIAGQVPSFSLSKQLPHVIIVSLCYFTMKRCSQHLTGFSDPSNSITPFSCAGERSSNVEWAARMTYSVLCENLTLGSRVLLGWDSLCMTAVSELAPSKLVNWTNLTWYNTNYWVSTMACDRCLLLKRKELVLSVKHHITVKYKFASVSSDQ